MGAYRSAMMPLQTYVEGMVNFPGISTHHIEVPVIPHHLMPLLPGFPGIPYFGKSADIASPPAMQLLPVCQSDLLEGLPVPIG